MARKTKSPTYESSVERTAFGQDLEVPIVVEYSYEPGEPCIMWGENAQPGCGPSVEIDSVVVKATGEAISLTEDEEGYLKDEIVETYND